MTVSLVGSWFSDINVNITDDNSIKDVFAINLKTATKTGIPSGNKMFMSCFFTPTCYLTGNLLQNYIPSYRMSWVYYPTVDFGGGPITDYVLGSYLAVNQYPGLIDFTTPNTSGTSAAKIQAQFSTGTFTGIFQINTRANFTVWDMGF